MSRPKLRRTKLSESSNSTAIRRGGWLCCQDPLRLDSPPLPLLPPFPLLLVLPRCPQFLNHCDANLIDDFVCVLGVKVVVVSKDRKQEPLAANRRRVARERIPMSDGPCFCEDARCRGRIFHAVRERAIFAGHGERGTIQLAPGLRCGIAQQLD